MKTHVKKEMKKYPYKKTRLRDPNMINQEKYAVVDKQGNVVGRFRSIATAVHIKVRMERESFGEKLKVMRITRNGELIDMEKPKGI